MTVTPTSREATNASLQGPADRTRPNAQRTLLASTAFLLFASAVSQQALAREEGHGFAEARVSAFTGTTGESWQAVQRFRPTLNMRIVDRVALAVTVEAGLMQGRDPTAELRRTVEESDLGPLLEAAGCTWPDRGHDLFRIHDASDYLEVDRLFIDVYQDDFDLRIGRQSLHWGSARFFNPTDPFPELLLAEPWRPRRGINAARLTVPFGPLNDVMAVAAIDDALLQPRIAGRARLNFAGVNLAAVGAWRGDEDDTLVGLDLRGTTVVGWWAEAALFPGSEPHTELAVGIDYSFPLFDRTVVLAQYYRNGAGATRPDEYARPTALAGVGLPDCEINQPDELAEPFEESPFAPVSLARDYLLLGTSFTFSPDWLLDTFMLQNLNDGTAFAIPTLTFIATGRLDLSLSAQIPFSTWGDGGEFRPRPQDTRFEFDLEPNLDPIEVDLSGLVPSSTITFWARFSI